MCQTIVETNAYVKMGKLSCYDWNCQRTRYSIIYGKALYNFD